MVICGAAIPIIVFARFSLFYYAAIAAIHQVTLLNHFRGFPLNQRENSSSDPLLREFPLQICTFFSFQGVLSDVLSSSTLFQLYYSSKERLRDMSEHSLLIDPFMFLLLVFCLQSFLTFSCRIFLSRSRLMMMLAWRLHSSLAFLRVRFSSQMYLRLDSSWSMMVSLSLIWFSIFWSWMKLSLWSVMFLCISLNNFSFSFLSSLISSWQLSSSLFFSLRSSLMFWFSLTKLQLLFLRVQILCQQLFYELQQFLLVVILVITFSVQSTAPVIDPPEIFVNDFQKRLRFLRRKYFRLSSSFYYPFDIRLVQRLCSLFIEGYSSFYLLLERFVPPPGVVQKGWVFRKRLILRDIVQRYSDFSLRNSLFLSRGTDCRKV